jgi:hypothetical protein
VLLIGIDPGASGGIAWRTGTGTIEAVPMPETQGDIVDLFRKAYMFRGDGERAVALIEQVTGFVRKQHAVVCKNCHTVMPPKIRCSKCHGIVDLNLGDPGASMFVFGKNAGFVEGTVMATGIRLETISARSWQKVFGLSKTYGEKPTEWKNRLKEKAQKVYADYPQLKITLKTADALLILEAGRLLTGQLF